MTKIAGGLWVLVIVWALFL